MVFCNAVDSKLQNVFRQPEQADILVLLIVKVHNPGHLFQEIFLDSTQPVGAHFLYLIFLPAAIEYRICG